MFSSTYVKVFSAIAKSVFSRITGTVFVTSRNQTSDTQNSHKLNVGLNLKFNVKNMETPGFTKKINNNWMYSDKTVQLVKDYMEFCPNVFECLNYNPKADSLFKEDIFPEDRYLAEKYFLSITYIICVLIPIKMNLFVQTEKCVFCDNIFFTIDPLTR